MTYFGDWVKDQLYFVKNIGELNALNESLTEEVNQLRYQNKLLELDKLELERLRELYELDKRYADYPKTGARVIGKDPGNWYEVFIIDKGFKDDIRVNMVVMAGSGLVGRITEVGPITARSEASSTIHPAYRARYFERQTYVLSAVTRNLAMTAYA